MERSGLLVKLSGKLNSEACHYFDFLGGVSNISKWSYIFINIAHCHRLFYFS